MNISEEQSDWANLPNDIFYLIAEKLASPLSHFVRMGSVCKLWRAAIMETPLFRCKLLKRCYRQVPFLMVPTKDKSQDKRGLYDIMDKKTYDVELPVPYNRRCCGSSYGWIATLDRTLAIRLINPFTGGIIDLPSVDPPLINDMTEEDEYEFYVKKVILSDDPYVKYDDFVVLALFGVWRSIAIIRPGEKAWTYTTSDPGWIIRKDDAIFHKGKFYVVDNRLGIVSVDVANTNPSRLGSSFHEIMIIPARSYTEVQVSSYIVESSDGEILVVQRFYHIFDSDHDPSVSSIYHHTVKFKVFMVQADIVGEARLVEVNNIGDDALFLGDNYSMAVVASRFSGCRSNSIYFNDDIIEFVHPFLAGGPHDTGIYNLESGCVEPFYDMDLCHLDMPPPFFIN